MEINQSTKTFAHLPLEAKHEIFSYLDYQSLKTATLVSKSWNDAISSSREFNSKTRLLILVCEKTKFEKFWRRYENVKLTIFEGRVLISIFNEIMGFSSHLIALEISFIEMPSTKEKSKFLDLLQQCERLKSLNIEHGYGKHNRSTKNPKTIVKLPSLEELKIMKFDWIVDSIECTTLQKLHIESNFCIEKSIAKFISTQTKLSSLACLNLNLETELDISPKFQLSEITIEHLSPYFHRSRPIQNMKNLIQSAAAGATLDVFCDEAYDLFHPLMAFISGLANINHLCMRLEDLSKSEYCDRVDYGNFDHIKSLKIGVFDPCCLFLQSELIDEFMSKFCQVESIEIVDLDEHSVFVRLETHQEILFPTFAKIPTLKELKMSLESFEKIHASRIAVLPHIETIVIPSCSSNGLIRCQKEIEFFGKRHETIRHVRIDFTDKLTATATTIDKIMKALSQGFPSAQTFEVQHCMGKKKLIFNRQEMRQDANE